MKKILSLLLVLCISSMLSVTTVFADNDNILEIKEDNDEQLLENSIQAKAAYPSLYPHDAEGIAGENILIEFVIFPEYNNEQLIVKIYDSDGEETWNAVIDMNKISYDGVSQKVKLRIKTDGYDDGKYTVKSIMRFYSLGEWHFAPYEQTSYLTIKKGITLYNNGLYNPTYGTSFSTIKSNVWDGLVIKSTNPKVASVDSAGKVTAKAVGCAHISYKTKDGVEVEYAYVDVRPRGTTQYTPKKAKRGFTAKWKKQSHECHRLASQDIKPS